MAPASEKFARNGVTCVRGIRPAAKLPDGDTLVTVGDTGNIFEISPDGDTRWSYATDLLLLEGSQAPREGSVFYATWHGADDAALAGRNLEGENPAMGMTARLSANVLTDALDRLRITGAAPLLAPGA
jgi:hypothetical protein